MNKEQLIALGLTEEQADKVINAYGQMVPKTRLDDKIQDLKELQDTLADRDKQLEELKKVDAQSLQVKITELQTQNETLKTEYETKLTQREFDYALENALRDSKAKNAKAVKALLDTSIVKVVDGKLVGLDEQLKSLKTSDEYLFQADGLKGTSPVLGNASKGAGADKNPFSKEHYNLTEQAKLFKENPELYYQLKTQATK